MICACHIVCFCCGLTLQIPVVKAGVLDRSTWKASWQVEQQAFHHPTSDPPPLIQSNGFTSKDYTLSSYSSEIHFLSTILFCIKSEVTGTKAALALWGFCSSDCGIRKGGCFGCELYSWIISPNSTNSDTWSKVDLHFSAIDLLIESRVITRSSPPWTSRAVCYRHIVETFSSWFAMR